MELHLCRHRREHVRHTLDAHRHYAPLAVGGDREYQRVLQAAVLARAPQRQLQRPAHLPRRRRPVCPRPGDDRRHPARVVHPPPFAPPAEGDPLPPQVHAAGVVVGVVGPGGHHQLIPPAPRVGEAVHPGLHEDVLGRDYLVHRAPQPQQHPHHGHLRRSSKAREGPASALRCGVVPSLVSGFGSPAGVTDVRRCQAPVSVRSQVRSGDGRPSVR